MSVINVEVKSKAYLTQMRYTAYIYTNNGRTKLYGNNLGMLIARAALQLDNEFTYGWGEIIDNVSSERVHRIRKAVC